MAIRALYLRSAKYLRRHGLKSSIKRLRREARNKIFYKRDVVFWLDLLQADLDGQAIPSNLRVERFDRRSGVPERLMNHMAEEYSEVLLKEYIQRRFAKGASLWCLRNETEDISYTWALTGQAMIPYYFPLTERDLHLFDGYTFPNFRGHGLNPVLLNHVLKYYRNEGFHRAYLETREWNTAVMRSVPKNGFIKIGLAKRRIRRGKCTVTWWY